MIIWYALNNNLHHAATILLISRYVTVSAVSVYFCNWVYKVELPLSYSGGEIKLSVDIHVQISVGIKALPQLQHGEDYLCLFGSNSSTVVGVVSPNEVRCQTPVIPRLPLEQGEYSVMHYNTSAGWRIESGKIHAYLSVLYGIWSHSRNIRPSPATQNNS